MKFKFLFIVFSITMLLFLVILVLMPRLMLGSFMSGNFIRIYWPVIAIWFLLFSAMNVFYFINRRLFSLLEKEDWPALVRYLEERVIQKARYSPRLVRLLANTYLVLSDSAAVMSLENKVSVAKPALVDANALVFGTARILGKDVSGAVRFFETRKNSAGQNVREWAAWYYGFALLLDSQYEKAGEEFTLLARMSNDGIIAALSSYFLFDTLARVLPDKRQAFRDISTAGQERVIKVLPSVEKWNKEVSRLSTEIHAAALTKYMEETRRWLYG